MDLRTALFNWVQIKLVAEARPDDEAAQETNRFFEEILVEDHGVTSMKIEVSVDELVHVHFTAVDKPMSMKFDRELSEQLLQDINANPKYN